MSFKKARLKLEDTPSSFSPIESLTDYLLSEIILIVVKMTWCTQEGELGPTCFPYIAFHVCKRWRSALLSDPRPWSYIHISTHSREDMVQFWHQKAGKEAIQFRLSVHASELIEQMQLMQEQENSPSVVDIIQWPGLIIMRAMARKRRMLKSFRKSYGEIFQQNLGRYRSIVVRANEYHPCVPEMSDGLVEYFRSYQSLTGSLERFFLQSCQSARDHSPLDYDKRKTVFPGGAPSIWAARIGYIFNFQSEIFSKLKTLQMTLCGATVVAAHSIVSQCSALSTLILDDDFKNTDYPLEPLPYFNLPKLSTLKFSGSPAAPSLLKFCKLFSHTPCRHIYFRNFRELSAVVSDDPQTVLDTSQSWGFPNLEVLTAHLESTQSENMVETEVDRIRVLSHCFPRIAVARLSVGLAGAVSIFNDKNIWAHLHTLRIQSTPSESLFGPFVHAVHSRLAADAQEFRLKRLELEEAMFEAMKEQDELKSLNSLVDVTVAAQDKWYSLGDENDEVELEEFQ